MLVSRIEPQDALCPKSVLPLRRRRPRPSRPRRALHVRPGLPGTGQPAARRANRAGPDRHRRRRPIRRREPNPTPKTRLAETRELIALRDVTTSLITSQRDGRPPAERDQLRGHLNTLYDNYVRRHGPSTASPGSTPKLNGDAVMTAPLNRTGESGDFVFCEVGQLACCSEVRL